MVQELSISFQYFYGHRWLTLTFDPVTFQCQCHMDLVMINCDQFWVSLKFIYSFRRYNGEKSQRDTQTHAQREARPDNLTTLPPAPTPKAYKYEIAFKVKDKRQISSKFITSSIHRNTYAYQVRSISDHSLFIFLRGHTHTRRQTQRTEGKVLADAQVIRIIFGLDDWHDMRPFMVALSVVTVLRLGWRSSLWGEWLSNDGTSAILRCCTMMPKICVLKECYLATVKKRNNKQHTCRQKWAWRW